MRYLLLILSLPLVLSACSSAPPIFTTRVDTVRVVPKQIVAEVPAVVHDSVVVGQQIVHHDTVVDVRYYPELKKFIVKAKPDTITVLRVDTVAQIVNKVVDPPLSQKIGYGVIGIVVFDVLVGIVVLLLKLKFKLPFPL